MNRVDKNLWEQILLCLQDSYGNPFSITELVCKMWPNETSDMPSDEEILQNIKYLHDNNLIYSKNIDSRVPFYALLEITNNGIDYLKPDGGLSASLGVITVKLHSDTIQQLLAAKIEQSNIPAEDKSRLKTMLGKMGDTALAKLVEKTIDAIPAAAAVAAIQSIIN